jgi:hypothetical protein
MVCSHCRTATKVLLVPSVNAFAFPITSNYGLSLSYAMRAGKAGLCPVCHTNLAEHDPLMAVSDILPSTKNCNNIVFYAAISYGDSAKYEK